MCIDHDHTTDFALKIHWCVKTVKLSEIYRNNTVVANLKVSNRSDICNKFCESSKLKNCMCEQ